MSTTPSAQQGGAQTPKPQPQQGQSGGSTQQQQGGRVIRDWASI